MRLLSFSHWVHRLGAALVMVFSLTASVDLVHCVHAGGHSSFEVMLGNQCLDGDEPPGPQAADHEADEPPCRDYHLQSSDMGDGVKQAAAPVLTGLPSAPAATAVTLTPPPVRLAPHQPPRGSPTLTRLRTVVLLN